MQGSNKYENGGRPPANAENAAVDGQAERPSGSQAVPDLSAAPVAPHGGVCLYGLAMTLRGDADGSAELCATPAELEAAADYLEARLAAWGQSRSDSEAAFYMFLCHCLSEWHEWRTSATRARPEGGAA